MPLISYTSPVAGIGWIDEDPVTHTSPTPVDAAVLQYWDDMFANMAAAINFLSGFNGGFVAAVIEVGGTYGPRPPTTGPVLWVGVDDPPKGGTTAGGAGYVAGLDLIGVPSS